MINILQWNINSTPYRYEELHYLSASLHTKIICLQETRLNPNLPFRFNNFTIFRQDAPEPNRQSHGGVAVLIHPSIPHDPVPLQTTLQAVAVRVLSPTPFTIINVYFPPHNPPSTQDLQTLITQCPAPLLLVGDVNARSPGWGSEVLDRRGSLIESLLSNNHLSVINTGAPTRFNV
jgi:exonuclease III